MKRCSQCGKEYAEKARFCPIDGTSLTAPEEAAAVIAQAPPPPPPPSPVVEPQKMPTPRTASSLRVNKECPGCGSQYVERMVFCPRDGQRLNQIPEPEEVSFFAPSAQSADTSSSTDADPLIGRTIADHYKLVAKIGQGGMGAVYKAEHVRITRPSAIKILNPEYAGNPEFVARFGREAELASRINHPNAVGIYDVGEEEDGLVYIAMEYVDGELLSKILKREGPLSLDRVVNITRQVAEALDAAHELDIVHRDLKPDNIMICQRRGKRDWVKVVDFGIAKRAHHGVGYQNLTRKGLILGTPEYMAPEQLLREPLDTRSDIYSLGLVAYRMLTGKLPFDGPTPQSRMIKKLTEPPISLRSARPGLRISPQVEAVIMKALATDRKTRYPTSIEFAAALENAAQSNAVYAVLAGEEENSWNFDDAETEASEAPTPVLSSGSVGVEDKMKNYQPRASYPSQAPSYPSPPPPPPMPNEAYGGSGSSLADTIQSQKDNTRRSDPGRTMARQQAATEPAQPVYRQSAEPPPMHRPVGDASRASYPPAQQPPPLYNQTERVAFDTRPENTVFQPMINSVNWKLVVAVIAVVMIVLVLLFTLAFWLSGRGAIF